ncbi:MAG TPA: MMPL family transporter [Solirubrobacterales bacterium]|nr:MMPL family transporter [Solirubrobacterales bacterium]
MSNHKEPYSVRVLRHRKLIVSVWILLAVVGAWAASSINDHLSQSFDAPGRPAFEANKEIVKTYGNGGLISPFVLVAAPKDGTLSEGGNDAAFTKAAKEVAAAVPGSRLAGLGAGGPAKDFESRDGKVGYAFVYPPPGPEAPEKNEGALSAVQKAAARHSIGGTPLRVTGVEALSEDSGGGGAGLLFETLIGALGALIVLALVFGSWLAIVPLIIAGASILTTFAMLRLLAEITQVSFVVQFLVGLIGLGVAIDYSLLVVFRWREQRAKGETGEAAVVEAMKTAGHAVAVSGFTVGIGLLAMVVVPVPFIRSIGFGGLMIPIVSVLAALTLLPILLASIGERLDRRHNVERDAQAGAFWTRWSTWVVRRRRPAAIAGVGILAALAVVALGLNPGQPSVDSLSSGGEAKTALTSLEDAGVGTGVLTPIEILTAKSTAGADAARLAKVEGVEGILAPTGPQWERNGTAVLAVVPGSDSGSSSGRDTLERVRDLEGDLPGDAKVGGPAAQDRDLTEAIYSSFPLMVAIIALVTFGLLARSQRSIVLPIKAILLNVLSIGAAFGIVVLIWQKGVGSDLIGGVPATGAIVNWVPLAIFAFLYGLSMDYEVFILSRVREEYDRRGDTDEAVIRGIGRTGRLVTSGAMILFLAFVALASGPSIEIKVFATGLAAGIALDATVVRMLVVPAVVSLLGKANWWLPGWANRLVSNPSSEVPGQGSLD